MRSVRSSLVNPSLKQFFLRLRERNAGCLRRHPFVVVGTENAAHQFALAALAGNHRHRAALQLLHRPFLNIQPQAPFPMLLIRPMAGKALFGE
jgi:hypothetical protein